MKNLIAIAILFAACLTARAIDATNLLTYQAVSGTNAGIYYDPAYSTPSATPLSIKQQNFLVQHSGIPTTNTLTVQIQASFDGTNFTTLATYRPSVTNAGLYTYTPRLVTNRFYLRAQVITTNSTTVGVTVTAP